MARINIEESWWTDPRRKRLAKLVGSEELADGIAVGFWRVAQEYYGKNRSPIPPEVFNHIEAAPKLIEAGLAHPEGEGIYASGALECFSWLVESRTAGRLGGKKSVETRRQKYGSAQPKPEATPNPPRSDSEGLSKSPEASVSVSVSRSLSKSKNTNTPVCVFDFESLWKKYPRRVNKSEALKRFNSVITSKEDYDALSLAIERYAANCAKNKIEERFIKHASTFLEDRESKPYVQHWRDWLEPDAGTVSLPKQEEPEWKRLAREKEERERRNVS